MIKLKENQLKEIKGGSATGLILLSILAIGTILAGVLDGYTRPLKCHE